MFKQTRSFTILFVAVLALACGHGGGVSLPGGATSMSLDDEWQLGNQMAAQVEQQVKLVRDPALVNYVRTVGERLHAQTPLANRPFDFEVVDDPNVNAFANFASAGGTVSLLDAELLQDVTFLTGGFDQARAEELRGLLASLADGRSSVADPTLTDRRGEP